MEIDAGDIESFKLEMGCFSEKMLEKVKESLDDWAAEVVDLAKQLVPVRSGFLRRTIILKVTETSMYLAAEAPYASIVEFGSRHTRARPYLWPAIEQNLPRLEQVLSDAVDSAATEAAST
jgi:HK97 gp10 family phage protein